MDHILDENDKNPEDVGGNTPFCETVMNGHLEACKVFIAKCPRQKLHLRSKQLGIAAQLSHLEIMKVILDAILELEPTNIIDSWDLETQKKALEHLQKRVPKDEKQNNVESNSLLLDVLGYCGIFVLACACGVHYVLFGDRKKEKEKCC